METALFVNGQIYHRHNNWRVRLYISDIKSNKFQSLF